MKTHLANSNERKHYLVNKTLLPEFKVQALYAGIYSTQNIIPPQPHKHNFYEIMLITNDSGTIYINDKTFHVRKEDIVLYYPQQEHRETADEGKNLKSIFFAIKSNNEILNNIIEFATLPNVLHTGRSYRKFSTLFDLLIRESQNKDIMFSDEISNCICKTILLEMMQLSASMSIPQKVNKLYESIRSYIDLHFTEEFQLKDVCEKLFINKFYVSKLFKSYMGITPARYIVEKRLELAKKLLTDTNLSVNEISEEIGYGDVYYFSKLFKQETGYSPKAFRNMMRALATSEMTNFIKED